VPGHTEARGLSRWLGSPYGLPTIAPTLVGLATFFVFLPALGNQFVNWDDEVNLVSNPRFRGLGWDQLRWMFSNSLGGHYIPVTWLSFALDYVLWGMRPAAYHATSIVLHTANAILFYFVARRLLHAAVQADGRSVILGASVAALLFSLHPLRVESVAWATERRDVLMGFFTLLCVLAHLRAVERGSAGALHRGWQWTAVGLFGLSLLSKSAVVGLPLLVGVLPLLGLGFFVGDGIEKIFVTTSIIIAVSSFSWGFRYHRRFHIFVFLVSAVALISIGWLGIDELYETPIVISGTLVLAAGHFLNRRLCRLCKECADEQASASETAQRGSDALLINERGDEHEI